MILFKKETDFYIFNKPDGQLILANNKICQMLEPVELWSKLKKLQNQGIPIFHNNVRLAKIQ